MKTKLILAFLLLCMTLSLCLAASAETVAYIAHNGGAAANEGLSDATPKNGLGGVSGTGVASVLKDGGTLVAEVTFRAAGADKAIALMKAACPDMLVGAGTVLTTEQIDKAIAAGASFIVSPGFDAELVAYCKEKNMPIYPGCTTPTDYHAAYKFGLEVVKFFPAEQSGGLAKIKAMSAPFPMFKVMPTGGISLKNLGEYISCPVICACGGSYMVTAELIEGGKWDEITELCKKSREIVLAARK